MRRGCGGLGGAKLRSFLAILGIIMGVGAVIAMLSIVEGARRQMQGWIGNLGTDVLFVWPDYRSTRGKGSVARLTVADAQAVLRESADVVRVSPVINTYAVIQHGDRNVQAETAGVAPTYVVVRNMTLETRLALRRMHRIGSKEKDDFGVFNQGRLLETENKAMGMFAIVLGGIGGICLLTGGIGIMNIMLVIVTERTREIGVRKALGARARDILRQFLLESVLISVLGGLVGVAGGVGLSWLIRHFTQLKTAVSTESVVISLGFAMFIGVFFGLYPAMQAAKLDPIEALARE